ncbi:hypothetical protein [Phaeacidiphilus oryzae]|uniref:hypothetical protein n=1 Tax=Phaeacidiphilus oryzae TaxID=348818 RepID=UPI00055EDC93|nr:hypothetical protein [Phaeacidiphilus oryzae]
MLDADATGQTADRATAEALLAASGLSPAPAETDALAAAYPALRAMAAVLHAVPEARYEAPAVNWTPAL